MARADGFKPAQVSPSQSHERSARNATVAPLEGVATRRRIEHRSTMNLWTTVLLAWVGVNLFLVALMWRYQWMKERSARLRAAGDLTASKPDDASAPCARAHLGWICRPPKPAGADRIPTGQLAPQRQRFVSLTSPDVAAAVWPAAAGQGISSDAVSARHCNQMQELRDEIRVLKLTVAELALEKAMLSAAVSRKKALS